MKLNNLKIFITGGAGFIGSHITEKLVLAGAKVKIYDNLSTGLLENISHLKDDIEFVKGDILDKEKLEIEMKGYDVVSHQAAQLEITTCMNDPIVDLTSNVIGSLNVFSAAIKNNVYKIINASSACTYGQMVKAVNETDTQLPNWEYGVSKLAAERYGTLFAEYKNIDIISLRYAIIYGPREWYGRVLTIFLRRLLNNLAPVVFGKGNEVRDFTFVTDVAELHNLCIVNDNIKNECFNVSTGIGTSVSKLADMVVNMGAPSKIFEDIKPGERSSIVEENRLRLPAELKMMVLDSTKAKTMLGWEPEVILESGLTEEYNWLKGNSNRWTKMSY